MRKQSHSLSKLIGTSEVFQSRLSWIVERLESRVLLSSKVLATVIYDVNGNGLREPGDDGLNNWDVFVDYNGNGSRDGGEPSGKTNIDGEALLSGVNPGTWDVREVLPGGWTPSPGYDVVININLPNNDQVDIWFLNTTTTSTGEVQGTVWNDIDHNGARDVGDAGLPNWTTFIDLNTNRALDPGEPWAITDANGFYSIPDLAPGQYKVREIVPSGWDATLGFDQSYTVDVSAGQVTVRDFGNFSVASVGAISGTVWNDVNADGVRQAGDAGLGGWTVFLDTNLNGLLDTGEPSALTNPGGVYSFPSVIAGTYDLTEIVQDGWFVSPGYSTRARSPSSGKTRRSWTSPTTRQRWARSAGRCGTI